MKYTIVFSEYFTRGSHQHSIVGFKRIVTNGDTLSVAVERYGIFMSQIHFILEDWPKLEGENEEPTESRC